MALTRGLSCWSSTFPKSRRLCTLSFLSAAVAGVDRKDTDRKTTNRMGRSELAMTKAFLADGLRVMRVFLILWSNPDFVFLPIASGANQYRLAHHTPRGHRPLEPDATSGRRRFSSL